MHLIWREVGGQAMDAHFVYFDKLSNYIIIVYRFWKSDSTSLSLVCVWGRVGMSEREQHASSMQERLCLLLKPNERGTGDLMICDNGMQKVEWTWHTHTHTGNL